MDWFNSLIGEERTKSQAQQNDPLTLSQYLSFFDKIIPQSPKKPSTSVSPIASVPNIHVFSTILSFLGYRDEIERLLQCLSKTTQRFLQNTSDVLSQYLEDWQPEVSGLIEFGRGSCFNLYPSKKYLRSMPRYRSLRLESIRYKVREFDLCSLSAIQFQFSDGFQTPYFKAQDDLQAKEIERVEQIDGRRKIRAISLKLKQSYISVTVLGLRLIDDFGNYIFNKTFHRSKEGAWATKYIPNGQEIVDIYCEANHLDFTKFCFFLRESKYALIPQVDSGSQQSRRGTVRTQTSKYVTIENSLDNSISVENPGLESIPELDESCTGKSKKSLKKRLRIKGSRESCRIQ